MGSGAVNEFAFSPCGHFLAVASQDGYLRIFNYDTMELVGIARCVYFGVVVATVLLKCFLTILGRTLAG